MLFHVIKQLQSLCPDTVVRGAHMELAKPSIPDGIWQCVKVGVTHIIAHPYMLSCGRHATEDIPYLVEASVTQYPNLTFEVTEPLGKHPDLAKLVLVQAKIGINMAA